MINQGLYSCFAQGSSPPSEAHQQFNFCCTFYAPSLHFTFKFIVVCFHAFVAVPRITASKATPNPRFGGSFFLECTVAGIPKPTIIWTKDGIPLNESNLKAVSVLSQLNSSRIDVSKAWAEYNGMYTCIASNDAGSVSESFLINLQGQL